MAEESCLEDLRYEIEQNVDGTTEQWLAYEMSTEFSLTDTELFDGGGGYRFNGVATLSADEFPTKTVNFTCFSNVSDDSEKAFGTIMTIDGKCTNIRAKKGYF